MSGGKPPGDDELVRRALAAQGAAYAPYSGFRVGAAVSAGGQAFAAANVENVSYGLSICAERNAVSRAVFEGQRALEAVAVATSSSPPAAPCGMCLQTLLEFAGDPAALRVVLANPGGERRVYTLAEMIPHGFSPTSLPEKS